MSRTSSNELSFADVECHDEASNNTNRVDNVGAIVSVCCSAVSKRSGSTTVGHCMHHPSPPPTTKQMLPRTTTVCEIKHCSTMISSNDLEKEHEKENQEKQRKHQKQWLSLGYDNNWVNTSYIITDHHDGNNGYR